MRKDSAFVELNRLQRDLWLVLNIEGKEYELEFDPKDQYVDSCLTVAFCRQLAEDFMPILSDHKGYGSKPYPPDLLAYRLIVDSKGQKLCVLYEVYWKRQDCTWRELNKDHDHDYEQIQVHLDLKTGKKSKVIVSSVGPFENAGHGVEVYTHIARVAVKSVVYTTSPKKYFPWGGDFGQRNATQVREMPIERLVFENQRPTVMIVNCYHAFVGLRKEFLLEARTELKPKLEKLDRKLLERWYYRNAKNRFGHDISKPFEEPYIMYYPPPEDWISRMVYTFLWLFSFFRGILRS